jgi:hypothetical protein
VALFHFSSEDSCVDSNRLNFAVPSSPFVTFGGIIFQAKVVPTGSDKVSAIQMRAQWENSGSTPTKTAATLVSFEPWNTEELPPDFGFPMTRKKNSVVIGPRGVSNSGVPIPMADWEQAQQRYLFVWGDAAYRDIFDGTAEHLTEFCIRLGNVTATGKDGPVSVDLPAADLKWSNQDCAAHNCYDENCPDYKQRLAAIKAK